MSIVRGTYREDIETDSPFILVLIVLLVLLVPLLPGERGKNITANIASMLFPLKNRETCMKSTNITPGCFTPVSWPPHFQTEWFFMTGRKGINRK